MGFGSKALARWKLPCEQTVWHRGQLQVNAAVTLGHTGTWLLWAGDTLGVTPEVLRTSGWSEGTQLK